jgi:hypothetical protein
MTQKTKNKMNRYQLLKQNNEINYIYLKNGIISYQLIRDMEIFEKFNQLESTITKEMKYILLGEEFELSKHRIEQIISTMSSKIE